MPKVKLICTHCTVEFERSKSQLNRSRSKNYFCSRSCANAYHNTQTPKRKLKPRNCKECGIDLKRTDWKDQRTLCEDCNPFCVDWSKRTYGDMKSKRTYQVNSRIRDVGRYTYNKSDKPKFCIMCGYSKHYEVCHIKGISNHSDCTPISEINSLDNMIALCRNHHWELDYGDLEVSDLLEALTLQS